MDHLTLPATPFLDWTTVRGSLHLLLAERSDATRCKPLPEAPPLVTQSWLRELAPQHQRFSQVLYRLSTRAPRNIKDRFGWTHPILFSPADPKQLFTAAQYVFRSDDDGLTWTRISPLTRSCRECRPARAAASAMSFAAPRREPGRCCQSPRSGRQFRRDCGGPAGRAG